MDITQAVNHNILGLIPGVDIKVFQTFPGGEREVIPAIDGYIGHDLPLGRAVRIEASADQGLLAGAVIDHGCRRVKALANKNRSQGGDRGFRFELHVPICQMEVNDIEYPTPAKNQNGMLFVVIGGGRALVYEVGLVGQFGQVFLVTELMMSLPLFRSATGVCVPDLASWDGLERFISDLAAPIEATLPDVLDWKMADRQAEIRQQVANFPQDMGIVERFSHLKGVGIIYLPFGKEGGEVVVARVFWADVVCHPLKRAYLTPGQHVVVGSLRAPEKVGVYGTSLKCQAFQVERL